MTSCEGATGGDGIDMIYLQSVCFHHCSGEEEGYSNCYEFMVHLMNGDLSLC